jgi:hypothetical protein
MAIAIVNKDMRIFVAIEMAKNRVLHFYSCKKTAWKLQKLHVGLHVKSCKIVDYKIHETLLVKH